MFARNATRATALAALAAGAAVALAGLAGAATAAPVHGQLTATTRIVNRYDSGGAGNWAYDTFTRTLTVTYLGKVTPAQIIADPALAATPYEFNASLADKGTFKDIPGAFTPNQGGHDAGLILRPGQVTGTMTGWGQFGVFYASAKDAPGLAPRSLRGTALNSLYPSSTWPELAFPAGTTFADLSEATFGYYYQVPAVTVTTVRWVHGHKITHVRVLKAQNWEDTAFDGSGQLRFDGNILGR
jgi:hypothetical protein